jgi:hypothetical protein
MSCRCGRSCLYVSVFLTNRCDYAWWKLVLVKVQVSISPTSPRVVTNCSFQLSIESIIIQTG